MKIRAAIAGATGYTGGELLRILLNHPDVDVVAATTTSSEGTLVAEVHRDLLGETGLKFGTDLNDPDVLFLCLGHGLSRQFIDTHEISPECRIIDLGNDFRLDGDYAGRSFVYGLCEQGKDLCRSAHDIANPGCFATAIQLACDSHHRLHRRREKTLGDIALQLQVRQHLHLQTVYASASC